MKESKNLSYSESMQKLDQILEDIDTSKISVDVLAARVQEAVTLLKNCKQILTETEAKVEEVLQDLEENFEETDPDEEDLKNT